MQRLSADALSARQRLILDGVAAGKSNGVLAQELGITLDGVKWHVSEMLGETGCRDRHELADWWRRERPPKAAPALLGLRRPASTAVAAAARIGFMLALTAVLSAGIYAGWTCRTATPVANIAAPGPLGNVAYVQADDIWVKALPGGEPHQITHGAPASAPKWSASGEWLSYRNADRKQVIRADGTDQREVAESAAWSPAADRFAYIAADGALLVEDADGGSRETFAGAVAGIRRRDILWAPDGTALAYAEDRRTGDAGVGAINESVLWRVAVGQQPVALYSSAGEEVKPGTKVTPALLPIYLTQAGGVLYFARLPGADTADGVVIEAVALDGHELRTFAGSAPTTLLYPSSISPDRSGQLAIVDGGGRESWTHKRLAVVSWQSGVVANLSDAAVAAADVAFSPDGRQIAYSAMPDAGGVASGDAVRDALALRRLWVRGRTGEREGAFSTTRQLTTDPSYRDEYPQWSSDGSQILFVRLDAQGRASLWKIRPTAALQQTSSRPSRPALRLPMRHGSGTSVTSPGTRCSLGGAQASRGSIPSAPSVLIRRQPDTLASWKSPGLDTPAFASARRKPPSSPTPAIRPPATPSAARPPISSR